MSKEDKALALWKQLFEYDTFPWQDVDSWGHCFFCGCVHSGPHADDCIYLAAKELVKDETNPD